MNDDVVIGEFTEGAPDGRQDEHIWRRIESYIVWRWRPRTVSWTVKGPGLFLPTVKPLFDVTVEVFRPDGLNDWHLTRTRRSPFGVQLDAGNFYRITATAGEDVSPPEDVQKAFDLLQQYMAEAQTVGAGVTSITESLPGVTRSVRRRADTMGRALEYSGAADLLRPYRYV